MTTVLITAFEPYERWEENSSWLALVELTQNLPSTPLVTTRLYPVDFAAMRERLSDDLAADYDYALHLGQAPGSARIRMEAMGVNIGGRPDDVPERFRPLVPHGPAAYQTALPLGDWVAKLRRAGIPSEVSYHAGTYVCNATLYLSHYIAEQSGRKTASAFLHLPLETSQTLHDRQGSPSMPCATMAAALRLILDELADDVC
jgi:pyroglutamyl-peptidase